jgi:hypothetical protein
MSNEHAIEHGGLPHPISDSRASLKRKAAAGLRSATAGRIRCPGRTIAEAGKEIIKA